MCAHSLTRIETDSFGPIAVPAEHYWGAQTQRSLENFKIGEERMPLPLVHALGLVKQVAVNSHNKFFCKPPQNCLWVHADAIEHQIDVGREKPLDRDRIEGFESHLPHRCHDCRRNDDDR